jgi:hypothetical protein
MEELKQELKQLVDHKYIPLDNQIKEYNAIVSDLREQRQLLEVEISDILRSEIFKDYKELLLFDGSKLKIKKPGTYSKKSNLNQGELKNYLDHYFQNAGSSANANDCFTFIVKQMKYDSLATEFKLERSVLNE